MAFCYCRLSPKGWGQRETDKELLEAGFLEAVETLPKLAWRGLI
ncbi:conserved protein of unknown function [Pseudomonas marincola]|uniref:Resolvase/invertase-type recombinase catalytic domain-containing protein n=1 Tax=Pseudomonas marincola TaxID=437900 RepID=A0A653DZ57_9PSED|nr:conserved protein of unknown function [Pseudomonas marincola]